MNSGTVFGLFLQVVPIALLVGMIYAFFRHVYLKKHDLPVRYGKETVQLIFVLYLAGLANLVLVPANLWICIWSNIFVGYSHCDITLFSGDFNLVPTVLGLLAGKITLGSWVMTMLAYNILMFIPFGFFLPLVSEKICNRSILKIAVIVPVSVELIQIAVGRSFDSDDIILNFVGIILGYFIAQLAKKICRKKRNIKSNTV